MPEFTSVYAIASPAWTAKLIFFLVIFSCAGWSWSLQFSSDKRARTIWSALIGLHAIPLALLLPLSFSWLSVAVAATLLWVTGYLVNKRSAGSPDRVFVRQEISVAFFCCLVLGAIFIAFTARPQALTHYDYYLNSNLLSLDLARSGSYASPWAIEHNIHNWFLVQMVSTVAWDAFEMKWLGTNTNLLPRLLELLTFCAALLLLARKSVRGAILFTVACALYIMEQSIQFRPHVFVGFFLTIGCLLLMEDRVRAAPVILIAILLALAKRDGLVLAPIVTMLAFRKISIRVMAAAFCGLLIAAAFLQIGGRSPLVYLYQTLFRPENLRAFLEFAASPLFLACFSALLFLVPISFRHQELRKPLMLAAAAFAMTLSASLILVDAGFLTPGTNMRKVLYVLAPIVLALACAYSSEKIAWPWGLNIPAKPSVIVTGLLLATIAFPLLASRSVTSNWTDAAVGGTHYLSSIIKPGNDRLSIGVYAPKEDSLQLSPFGDLYTFKWPFLIAFTGSHLKFADDLSLLQNEDLIFLPPDVDDPTRIEIARKLDRYYFALYGVYGVLAKPSAVSALALEQTKALPNSLPRTTPTFSRPLSELEPAWISPEKVETSKIDYPNDRHVVLVSWPTPAKPVASAATLRIMNPDRKLIRFIEFYPPPGNSSGISRIVMEDAGREETFDAATLLHGGKYSLPINSRNPISLRFEASPDRVLGSKSLIGLFDLRADVEEASYSQD